MINTNAFIDKIVKEGYTHLCVVPCSFVTSLINAAINMRGKIEYLPCSSEAVACSIAAGLKISGKRPIVIAQSSGLTNMGSCVTSLLNPYDIHFPIIISWRSYQEGDSEIQHKHLASKLTDLIEAYGYSFNTIDQDDISKAIEQVNGADVSKEICVLKKDTFSKVDLLKENEINLSAYPSRGKYLLALDGIYKNIEALIIGTTGNTAREIYTFMQNTQNFYMVGNMGGALSVGLGAAKAGKKVVVCGGDAEFVMHMGGLTTAGRYAAEIDLTYIIFDNESNKSTGGQNTFQTHVDYKGIAESSGFTSSFDLIKDVSHFENVVKNNVMYSGLRLIVVKCGYDEETARPPISEIKKNSV